MLDIRDATDVEITGKLFRGICHGLAVNLFNCTNVVMSDCEFDRIGMAVRATECTNVTVTGSTYRHLRGSAMSATVGAFVQFDKCDGGEVSDCSGFCDPTVDGPIDIINIFQSTGVDVLRNRIQGRGTSGSGSGIMVGDEGGSGHVVADNVLIDPGQVGIGVPGGSNIQVLRNTIYGPQWASSNVGIYVHNYADLVNPMSGIEVADNVVDWRNAAGTRNGWWQGERTGTIAGLATNDWSATLDPDAL